MASMLPELHVGSSPSMARSAVAEAELEGWARIAEGMMAEALLATLTDVQEPQARAVLVSECALAQLAIAQQWIAALPPREAPVSTAPTDTANAGAGAAAEAEARLSQLCSTLAQKQSEVRQSEEHLKELQGRTDALWSEHTSVNEALAELNGALEVSTTALAALRAQQALAHDDFKALERHTDDLREARHAVAQELDAVHDIVRADVADRNDDGAIPLCASVRALVHALASQKARAHELEVQLDRAKEAERIARTALEDQAGTHQGTIAQLDVALAEKQSALHEVTDSLSAAQHTLTKVVHEQDAARRTVEALRQEAARITTEHEAMAAQLSQQEAAYSALQQDTVALQEERAGILDNLKCLQRETDALHVDVAHAATVLQVPSVMVSDSGTTADDSTAIAETVAALSPAVRALVDACEASRAREREAVAELAQALEMVKAYESQLSSVSALPEPMPRPGARAIAEEDEEGPEGAEEADAYLDDQLPVAAPVPRYQRVLPPEAVNPVTASLLRVKAQARELREPSLGRLADAIASPARRADVHVVDGSVQTPKPTRPTTTATATNAHSAHTARAPVSATSLREQQPPPLRSPFPVAGQTPTLSRALYYSQRTPRAQGSYRVDGVDGVEDGRPSPSTLHSAERSTSSLRGGTGLAAASSTSWKAKMGELQNELRGLRSDLGASK